MKTRAGPEGRSSGGSLARIGDRLKQERRLAGMSREALGQVLGASPETIEKYEKAEEWLPAHQFAEAAGAFGLPLSAFFYENACADPNPAETVAHERWVTIPRPLKLLSSPDFAQAAPLVSLWNEKRGKLTDDVEDALLFSGLLSRIIILRRPPGSSGLFTAHIGSGIAYFGPFEILGRDIREQPDCECAALMADAYDQVLWHNQPMIEASRAIIRTWDGKTVDIRYDRVFIPWRWRGSDRFAMGISLRRQMTELSSATAAIPP